LRQNIPAWRRGEVRKEAEMQHSSYELEVLVHGKPVREYPHEDKHYIEGKKDSEFTLRFHNRSSDRVLGVLSVDGLSIMDGKDCSFDSGGYVLEPYSKVDVPGWRLDMEKVAKFFFSASAGSYAGAQGKPRNVGVIGCAVFREKQREIKTCGYLSFQASFHSPPSSPLRGSSLSKNLIGDVEMRPDSFNLCSEEGENSVQCNASRDSTGAERTSCSRSHDGEWKQLVNLQQLGTGFGAQSGHRVEATTFTRLDVPEFVFEIHYDSREALLQRGVDLAQKPAIVVPCPFPGNQFCRPPAGWTGK
jgi:hypothetical protein